MVCNHLVHFAVLSLALLEAFLLILFDCFVYVFIIIQLDGSGLITPVEVPGQFGSSPEAIVQAKNRLLLWSQSE